MSGPIVCKLCMDRKDDRSVKMELQGFRLSVYCLSKCLEVFGS